MICLPLIVKAQVAQIVAKQDMPQLMGDTESPLPVREGAVHGDDLRRQSSVAESALAPGILRKSKQLQDFITVAAISHEHYMPAVIFTVGEAYIVGGDAAPGGSKNLPGESLDRSFFHMSFPPVMKFL